MQFKIQMIIQDEHGETKTEDIITLDKPGDKIRDVGLSLQESQELLKALQKTIICHQAEHYTKAHIACPHCQKSDEQKANTRFNTERCLVSWQYAARESIAVIVRTRQQKP